MDGSSSQIKKTKTPRFGWIKRNWKKSLLITTGLFLIYFIFCLPDPLFEDPVSTVIVDRHGNLLGAKIANDEQWRFPYNNTVPEKFAIAITCYEDKRFFDHPGVDIAAMARAAYLNISKGKIVSGGSTLSMQTIRLSRKGQERSFFEKFLEIIKAVRLETRYSKEEILGYYASYAPFGGNIVGLDAAAWKYFSRPAENLSWAEIATLAVIPNAPSIIHPGKNRKRLLEKRNLLLDKLFHQNHIDSLTCYLAKQEDLPLRPLALPSFTPHLLDRIQATYSGKQKESILHTTIDLVMQQKIKEVAKRHHDQLKNNGIFNLSVLVLDVKTGEVLSYLGNTPVEETGNEHGYAVDIISSPRSSGSLFKPFLYAAMLSEGALLPKALVPDIPSNFHGFTPKNFDHNYAGAIPADEALYRSLNVPLARMLSEYGISKFYTILKNSGISTMPEPATHYGLSMVLGGAETNSWDMACAYRGLINVVQAHSKNYPKNDFVPFSKNKILLNENVTSDNNNAAKFCTPAASWHTLEALLEVKRPGLDYFWQQFSSSKKIAWKTGTSFGFRDAWSVGCTPDYIVVVWCGNANGEGRPGLTGVEAAAPLMFDVFGSILTTKKWFQKPTSELVPIEVCKQSGFRAKSYCEKDTLLCGKEGLRSKPCPYHKEIHLDKSEKWQVDESCESPFNMVIKPYFVLSPAMEWYYKRRNPEYIGLPDYRSDCSTASIHSKRSFQLIYPSAQSAQILIPINLDESMSSTVFQASHHSKEALLYWHIDNTYIGMTKNNHEMAINAEPGKHVLTIVDDKGELLRQNFEVLK